MINLKPMAIFHQAEYQLEPGIHISFFKFIASFITILLPCLTDT